MSDPLDPVEALRQIAGVRATSGTGALGQRHDPGLTLGVVQSIARAALAALPAPEVQPDSARTKYEAEKVMDPILRTWFAIDLDPVDAERNAENAAVDLSWHLENVGLLNRPTLIDEEGVEHICDALIEVGPWDEIDGDGTEASIIADHIRDLGRRLVPMCWCESPKPGAHAQSCPRFGMNP